MEVISDVVGVEKINKGYFRKKYSFFMRGVEVVEWNERKETEVAGCKEALRCLERME